MKSIPILLTKNQMVYVLAGLEALRITTGVQDNILLKKFIKHLKKIERINYAKPRK